MFLTLLIVTLAMATFVSFIAVRLFSGSITTILDRIISDKISRAWVKYLKFAIYVVGISGGVRIRSLERYITAGYNKEKPIDLNIERWVLEIYRTIIESLQSIAWLLLVFFIFALIAYVIVRGIEARKKFHDAIQENTTGPA